MHPDQVITFRLARHGLLQRTGSEELEQTVARCGLQNSPPGSAALALTARIDGLTPEALDAELTERKSLVLTWAMRGAPFLVPVSDAAVFTTGVLPPTETGRLHLIRGVEHALTELSLGLDEVTDLIRPDVRAALTGRHLDVTEIGEVVAPRTAERLSGPARQTWLAEGPYAAGQPLGEGVVHFVLRLLALEGLICIVPATGGSPFALVEEWFGGPFATMDPELARAELLRRYLRSYGPSTRAEFAAWLGVTAGDAKAWWEPLADGLTEVTVDQPDGSTRRAWIIAEDAALLEQAPALPGAGGTADASEVRFLPVSDPYTQCRDRETIVAKEHHRSVETTRSTGNSVGQRTHCGNVATEEEGEDADRDRRAVFAAAVRSSRSSAIGGSAARAGARSGHRRARRPQRMKQWYFR